MVQRKGNLPVKDGRSSEERDQEDLDIMAAVSKVRVPTPPLPQPWGVFLLTQLRELGKVSLNWSHHLNPVREPNLVEDKLLLGQGKTLCEDFQ